MRAGTRLSYLGVDYVQVTGSAATVTVSGGEVTATGASGNSYRVFAPGRGQRRRRQRHCSDLLPLR